MRKRVALYGLIALVIIVVLVFGSRWRPDPAKGLATVDPSDIPADVISRCVHADVPVTYRAYTALPDGGMLAYTYQERDLVHFWIVRYRNDGMVREGGGELDTTAALSGWLGDGYMCGVILGGRIANVEGTTAHGEKVRPAIVNGFWFMESPRADDPFASFAVLDTLGRTMSTGGWSLPATGPIRIYR